MKIAAKYHRKRNFNLIHQSNSILNNSHNISNSQINIFKEVQSPYDYFTTCPTDNPFQNTKRQDKKKILPYMKTQQPIPESNERQPSQQKQSNVQEVYKINSSQSTKFYTIGDTQSYSLKKYQISNASSQKVKRLQTQRAYSHGKIQNEDKWAKRINKYLFKKSLQKEIIYNQDLRTRCGDQYFEQVLRQRYKDQIKPQSFIYSIKETVEHDSKYINFIKNLHPEMKLRNKMTLKGINKSRASTELDKGKSQKCLDFNKLKIRLNMPKIINKHRIASQQ